MVAAKGTFLDHVTKESSDVKRLAQFYQERNLASRLSERLCRASESAADDPKYLPTGHHMCFTVPNFDFVVQTLKDKGIEIHLTSLLHRKTRQAFFFDPGGNGLENASPLGEV